MEDDLTNILKAFYDKLHYSIIREKTKLLNESVLWTLVELSANRTEKFLSNSSYSTAHFPREKLSELLAKELIHPFVSISNKEEFVLTAKGIWEIEKQQKDFSEDTLLSFMQEKHLTFNVKPMNDKEKLVIFLLLCIRNFSDNIPMDLSTSKNRDGWQRIFKVVYEFLSTNGFLKAKQESFDKFISTKGSEHPVQSFIRHINDLPIKSGQIFCNPPGKKYASKCWLDLELDGQLQKNKLTFAFKLVFPKIPDFSTTKMIEDFCIEIANDYSKYVVNDYRFIDSTHDDIIRQVIKDIYVG